MAKEKQAEAKVLCSYCQQMVRFEMPYDVPIYAPHLNLAICRRCLKDIYHIVEKAAADNGEEDAEIYDKN